MRSALQGTFVRRVATLLAGSAIAQALPILVAPLLTRLFGPGQMGQLGLYLAAATILGTVVTLRYENAMLLPQESADAASLLVLTVSASIGLSLMVGVVLLVAGESFRDRIGLGPLGALWVWIPIGAALLGIFQVLNAWQIRSQRFTRLAVAKVAQAAGMAAIQVVAGFARLGAVGLCVGQVAGQFLGVMVASRDLLRLDRSLLSSVRLSGMRRVAGQFRRFPAYSLPADLINVLANQLPLFLMGHYFGPIAVGFYALTQRVLAAPVAMVGNAVLDVFKERAAADFRERGDCRPLFRRTLRVLCFLALPPSLLLFAFGPDLFAWVFGREWREAGEYARLLAPMLLVRFVASPLSYVFYIAEKQSADLAWQACLLVVTTAAVILGGFRDSPRLGIGLFSAAYSVMYIVYLFMSYRFAKAPGPARGAV